MVHTGGGRRRGKSRPRILYWFRTPPNVRIGRSALDESAIRLIEEYNPDVEFDWTRILKGQETPEEQRGGQPERRGKPRPRDYQRPSATVGAAPPLERAQRETPPVINDSRADLPAPADPTAEPLSFAPAEDAVQASDTPMRLESPIADPAPIDEAAIDELLSDAAQAGPTGISDPSETVPAAQARLGSEGLSRLRARHAEVLARISEAVADPLRRDELKSQAERLNPDTWVTDGEVTEGLERYETVFESLRTVVGRRRKRRRRSRSHGGHPGPEANERRASPLDPVGGEGGTEEGAKEEEDDGEDPGEL